MKNLEDYLQSFFKAEKKNLLFHYPGLTLHRLREDLKLHAFLNGVDSEELFIFPYIPYTSNPITSFFLKLKEGIPLEYITGHAYFYRSLFKVTPDVLIPRSETEILVELASLEIKKRVNQKSIRIADVGTGSGNIALSLMMDDFKTLEMVAIDISENARALARENFYNLYYTISKKHSCEFIKSDRLFQVEGDFDIILSNPPYIKKNLDQKNVHHQVINFEPSLALFLDDDQYYIWFEEFFKSIFIKLRPMGISIIEGHEDHLESLSKMALGLGFSKVDLIKDYTNRYRFLKLYK